MMMKNGMAFRFVDNINNYQTRDGFVARIPAGIEGRDQLLKLLYKILNLPGYFGFNWDALSDCLRDFHWIEKKVVTIIHEDLPNLDNRELKVYLELLSEAIVDWKAGEEHEIEVIFPMAVKDKIDMLFISA
jgi:RNAse (barnase) inhibitor barstar